VVEAMSEPYVCEQIVSTCFQLAPPLSLNESGHEDVLHGREFGKEVVELKDEAEAPISEVCEAGARQLRDIGPIDEEFARGGDVQRPQTVEKRRLSRAGLADDADHLAGFNGKIDATKDLQGPPFVLVDLLDVLRFDESHRILLSGVPEAVDGA
jgi:hypothetical protein